MFDQSKSNRGRCSGESVTVLCDGEPIEEYIGTFTDAREGMNE